MEQEGTNEQTPHNPRRTIVMKRKGLINRLMARKLKANRKRKEFCVCMAKRLSFASSTPSAPANRQDERGHQGLTARPSPSLAARIIP
jgi:hypothetical protein